MAVLHLKEEEVKAQMAALSEKHRELDLCLQEMKDFTLRLSRLVVKVVECFLQLSQKYSDQSPNVPQRENEVLSPAGRLTTCLLHVGRTSDWHECETKVERSPR